MTQPLALSGCFASPCSAVRLSYVYDQILPSVDTDTEQVLNTVAALGRRGVEIELVVPAPPQAPRLGARELADHYQVSASFEVRAIPARLAGRRPLQKAVFAAEALSLGAPAADRLIYTRNLAVLGAAVAARRQVAYEHYRPWPDQVPPLQPLLRWWLRSDRCVGVVLHSDHARQSYLAVGVTEHKLMTLHNGYDPKKLEPQRTTAQARVELGLDPRGPLVVYAGHINERKGLDVALQMARLLPEVTFLLVGSTGEGVIERAARQLSNVKVVPRQPFDRVVVYLYAADVLLIPPSLTPLERYGTTVLPMKLFGYLAVGRPVLAPDAPDTAELLGPHNCVRVPPGDAAAAAGALVALLRDPSRAQRLAGEGQRTVSALTWDARAERLERFLRAGLAGGQLTEGRADRPRPWSSVEWARQSVRWTASQLRR